MDFQEWSSPESSVLQPFSFCRVLETACDHVLLKTAARRLIIPYFWLHLFHLSILFSLLVSTNESESRKRWLCHRSKILLSKLKEWGVQLSSWLPTLGSEKKSLYYLGYFDNNFWPALSTTLTFIMQKGMSEEVPNSVWQRATTSTWELNIVLW